MMESAIAKPGDVYCPFCFSEGISMRIERSDVLTWECERGCSRVFDHAFTIDADGRFAWVWDEKHPRPNPGCPWCGTCNLSGVPRHDDQNNAHWQCYRSGCLKRWIGRWNRSGDWTSDRWTIRIPCSEVPWASGTIADLECYRRDATGRDLCFVECCRFPKSCSAFDPGFTTGKGPTTLPIVWNDGYGWRSGPPDLTNIRETSPRMAARIQSRWDEVKPLEVSDGDGCGQGCEYICRCY